MSGHTESITHAAFLPGTSATARIHGCAFRPRTTHMRTRRATGPEHSLPARAVAGRRVRPVRGWAGDGESPTLAVGGSAPCSWHTRSESGNGRPPRRSPSAFATSTPPSRSDRCRRGRARRTTQWPRGRLPQAHALPAALPQIRNPPGITPGPDRGSRQGLRREHRDGARSTAFPHRHSRQAIPATPLHHPGVRRFSDALRNTPRQGVRGAGLSWFRRLALGCCGRCPQGFPAGTVR